MWQISSPTCNCPFGNLNDRAFYVWCNNRTQCGLCYLFFGLAQILLSKYHTRAWIWTMGLLFILYHYCYVWCSFYLFFFFCSLSLGCHFVIIFIDFCVFFPGKMVRGRSYRCCTGGSHWCCILCIAQGHRFVNQSLRTILVNWWEFMAWGLLVWNRYSLKI